MNTKVFQSQLYIQGHLSEDLSLEQRAKQAQMSSYGFHRHLNA